MCSVKNCNCLSNIGTHGKHVSMSSYCIEYHNIVIIIILLTLRVMLRSITVDILSYVHICRLACGKLVP